MSDYPITKDTELVLKSSGAQGTGSVNGAGIAAGPSGLIEVRIIVSAVASGGTLDVHLESSSDNGVGDAYADIPNTTFTQITATGVYRLWTRLPEKWVRYAATVGTNTVTWEAFIGQAPK